MNINQKTYLNLLDMMEINIIKNKRQIEIEIILEDDRDLHEYCNETIKYKDFEIIIDIFHFNPFTDFQFYYHLKCNNEYIEKKLNRHSLSTFLYENNIPSQVLEEFMYKVCI